MHKRSRVIGVGLAAAVALSVTLFATDAASKERRERPPRDIPAAIQLTPNPLAINCDGVDSSTITVNVTDARGKSVPDGTVVHFDARFGTTDPVEAPTRRGKAQTEVRFFPAALQFPRQTEVNVFVGELRASIGVDCIPPVPCNPFSPPAHPMSPPCEPLPCSTTDSPPIGQSPPCPNPTPPVTRCWPQSPPCPPFIQLDADPGSEFVEGFGSFTIGSPFRIGIRLPNELPDAYTGYEWAIEWPKAGLRFDDAVLETGPALGLDECSDEPRAPVIDPAYDDAHIGRCVSASNQTSYSGSITEFSMSCLAPGLFKLSMIDARVASDEYTTLFGPSGPMSTLAEGIFIECQPQICGPAFSPPCATPTPFVCGGVMSPPCGTPEPRPTAILALDTDITNGAGPCTQIDDEAAISAGDSLQVGVCLINPGAIEPIAAFNYRIAYDDRIVVAPEMADAGTGLDDNPDANAGSTTFTSATHPVALGGGWDCSAGVGAYPKGDTDGVPQDGDGTVFSGGCGSAPGPNTLIRGPLGVITFNALASGSTPLKLFRAAVTNDSLSELGSCDPVLDVPMLCLGATIVVTGDVPTSTLPPPTSTPTATSTPPATSLTPIIVDNRRPRRL
jgi:hypothetical protein